MKKKKQLAHCATVTMNKYSENIYNSSFEYFWLNLFSSRIVKKKESVMVLQLKVTRDALLDHENMMKRNN
jgi:hypothetical protein